MEIGLSLRTGGVRFFDLFERIVIRFGKLVGYSPQNHVKS